MGIEWLGIAHVHHGLREGTADRDAAFVEAFARKHNVPFFLKKLDGVALKNAEGSLEENARDARYKALQDVAKNCDAIVTAHHAGDQAETIYMRLRRGTTLAGLRGIQEIHVLGNSQGVAGLASEAPLEGVMEDRATGCNQGDTSPLIINHPSSIINHQSLHSPHFIYRPFLNVTREELLAYARENNLEWCEDESNDDVTFARNKVRHDLLPHLEQECSGATEQLCRIAGIADRAYAKVIEACKGLFDSIMIKQDSSTPLRFAQDDTHSITLDKKKLNKILRGHADADLSEMFRLWLSEQGFRFPIGFFYSPKESAHVKIPVRAAYRKRSIAKIGRTVRICEFSTPEEAQKFVSCE